jgi:hypothetical protein
MPTPEQRGIGLGAACAEWRGYCRGAMQLRGGDVMSRAGVGTVIEKLLTDENLRIRFALDQIETVAELCLRGVELTRDEVDLFCWTNARLWFLGDEVRDEWQH